VFDAGQKCLLGIMSRKIYVRSADAESDQKDIAKYFVPASTIRALPVSLLETCHPLGSVMLPKSAIRPDLLSSRLWRACNWALRDAAERCGAQRTQLRDIPEVGRTGWCY
jgi:hypothetical protein